MQDTPSNWLITPATMAKIDADAIRSGIPGSALMERAGQAVAATALRHFPETLRFCVLCGPGNNGGDGYVAARALAGAGADVALFHLGDPDRLYGDAAEARRSCPLASAPLEAYRPYAGDLVIDAIFGAGLARDVPDVVAQCIEEVAAIGIPVLAVDLPSGIDGLTGRVRGAAFVAKRSVSFVGLKPGHVLLPGRDSCGPVEVYDIGIPRRIVEANRGLVSLNSPRHLRPHLRKASAADHKYRRGHLTVFSGPVLATGAARLSAEAGLRAGAGVVALASGGAALAINAAHTTAVMLTRIDTAGDLAAWLEDDRRSTFVLGPGFGDRALARSYARAILGSGRKLVLDADGLTAFAETPELRASLQGPTDGALVITPHEGEFARLFPALFGSGSGKLDMASAAAAQIGGVVVFKGADTVIAAPDGRVAVETSAPPSLATAGSGDVLAGIIGAHLANGVPAFEAACAGVHRHSQAALKALMPMTAEDLVRNIPPLDALD
ncbi:NAD(P)H-hydrate dehydratase [Peteryoungia ipomoeae]|uniref:Bifunctional NAD(P)H-hydrate repair enzyme n=1 Tax=Peteryoungia ipomoeae TaxID=1210932 RepID=A0A4S8P518_9HYPH|nr:NAD(P)H-hydrate dehydratase [Peteryoungia ipomoeae]THV25178.1 NAD(P)H-hydrate dehydratase [Peteryoungia ipomoeae]